MYSILSMSFTRFKELRYLKILFTTNKICYIFFQTSTISRQRRSPLSVKPTTRSNPALMDCGRLRCSARSLSWCKRHLKTGLRASLSGLRRPTPGRSRRRSRRNSPARLRRHIKVRQFIQSCFIKDPARWIVRLDCKGFMAQAG